MTDQLRLAAYAVLMFLGFGTVLVATWTNSALPLFFGFVPALGVMWLEGQRRP